MLTNTELKQYLGRLSYSVEQPVSISLLKDLHRQHLYHIPFENLDIPLGNTISLSKDAVFNKIIQQKRGGFCYEVNYAFALLLKALGFKVRLLSARVFNEGSYGAENAHVLLLVEVESDALIVDVGFGGSYIEPIVFEPKQGGLGSRQHNCQYRIELQKRAYVLLMQEGEGEWVAQYTFSLEEKSIMDFVNMCTYQQCSPDSVFTQKTLCSIATPEGRKTISNGRFLETLAESKTKKVIADELEYRNILREHFNIELPVGAPIKMLLEEKYA